MSEFNPLDMPIVQLDEKAKVERTSRFEASRFLGNPKAISAFLAEAMRDGESEHLMEALGEVAKAIGINKIAQQAGVNRESLYKTFKSGTKPRFDTVMRVLDAFGVELAIQPKIGSKEHEAAKNVKIRSGSVKIQSKDGRIEEHRVYLRNAEQGSGGYVLRGRDSTGRFVSSKSDAKPKKSESKAS